jgi:creatinine amidohydrolase
MLWHEQTSPKIAALDRDIPIVIPIASCEQHGNHLPLITDTLQLDAIISRVEKKLTDSIVTTPVLWLGASHHHLDFPGPLSLSPCLYSQVIQELTCCFLNHGFRRLFFLNGHGGNFGPTAQALTDLIVRDDRADAATIALGSWWGVCSNVMKPEITGMETPTLTHACEYETSLVLALREDLVHLESISADHVEKKRPWTVNPKWGRVEGFHRFHRWTSSGHMGKPELANPQKGEKLLHGVVDTLVEFLQEFATWPRMHVLNKTDSEA